MSRKKFRIAASGIAAVSLSALLLSGCSADLTEDAAASTASSKPTAASPAESPSPTLPSGPVTAQPPGLATSLAQLDDQTGGGSVEGIPTDFEALSFATDCYGAGTLEVTIPGLGGFTVQCSDDSRNPYMLHTEVQHVDGNLDVIVAAEDNVHWALSVSGGDAISTAPQTVPTSG